MANDAQKRSVLDQLTDEATAPQSIPDPLSPIVGSAMQPLPAVLGPTPNPPYEPSTTASVDDSTKELEGQKSSPEEMAARETAAKAENPPTFLDKLKKFATPGNIARTVGGIGDALALAAGTPEQKQIAEEDEQMPLKLAQIANEREWRQGMLGINQQKANTGDRNAATKENVANNATIPTAEAKESNLGANTAKTQYELEVMKQGQFPVDPITAQLVNRPDLANKPVSAALWTGMNKVLEARGLKTADLGQGTLGDPTSGGLWVLDRAGNKIHQVSTVSPSATRANALLERNFHPFNDAAGNTLGMWNPSTNQYVTPESIHPKGNPGGPSMADTLGSNAIPPKPTGTMLTQGQMAQTVVEQLPKIQQEIGEASDHLGAIGGRWNQWFTNKAGANDPAFAHLDEDLVFLASAMAKAHFGASAPQQFVEALHKNFGEAQSPDDLLARISSADSWMQGYAAHAGARPAPATPTVNSTPTRPKGVPANAVWNAGAKQWQIPQP